MWLKRRGSLPSLALSMADGDGDGDGGGGGGSDHWGKDLPEGVQAWDEVKNSDTPEKFWDQMTNMRSHLGQSIRIPGENAGEEDVSKFHQKVQDKVPGLMKTPNFDDDKTLDDLYTRMGRPEKSDAYTVPDIKDVNGEVIDPTKLDMTLAESFKDLAHGAGLSQKKYTEIVRGITKINMERSAVLAEAQRKDQDALAAKWGVKHEVNTKTVNVFLDKVNAPEHIKQAVLKGGADGNTMEWFFQLATQTINAKGENFIADEGGGGGGKTPEEATVEISEIRNNPKHPYNIKNDPGHKAAMAHVKKLYQYKNPTTGQNAAASSSFPIGGIL